MIEIFLEDDEASLIYSLLNELRKPVPKNLCPTFYRTLTYEGDVRLKERADDLAEKLGIETLIELSKSNVFKIRITG